MLDAVEAVTVVELPTVDVESALSPAVGPRVTPSAVAIESVAALAAALACLLAARAPAWGLRILPVLGFGSGGNILSLSTTIFW